MKRFLLVLLLVMATIVPIHEFGHLLAAKYWEIPAPRYSLGFGPILHDGWSWGETRFTLSAIPLGGYVQMDAAALGKAPALVRFAIAFAGPAVNLLSALLVAKVGRLSARRPKAVGLFVRYSLALAVMNMTPISLFDGTAMLFALIEAVSRHPVSAAFQGSYVMGSTLLLLWGLMTGRITIAGLDR